MNIQAQYAAVSHPALYKRDSKGKVRIWSMNQEGDRYQTVSGLLDGERTTSAWTTAEPKNVGKANETDGVSQASLEVEASYTKKLKTGYFRDEADIDKVAFTKPMLAREYTEGDLSNGAWSQPKLDGMRCIARADGLWTRTGKPIVTCPHVIEALAPLFNAEPDLILDGELYNHDLRDDFNELMSILRKGKPNAEHLEKSARVAQYHIYDIPAHPGNFSDRAESLRSALEFLPSTDCLRFVPTAYVNSQRALDELQVRYADEGYEGQMVRFEGPYEAGKRSKLLLKRKEWLDDEFQVVSMQQGTGNWAGAIKTFTVTMPNGGTSDATLTGSYETLQKLAAEGVVPVWAKVKFFGFTPDGKLRMPSVTDWGFTKKRED